MGSGSISLLVDSPLRDVLIRMRSVPQESRKRILVQSKANVEPIWKQETRERAETRIQHRVLVDSARVGVTARNVFLRSGAVGSLSDGTPVDKLASAAEFGRNSDALIKTRSRKGTRYTRRTGPAFRPRNRTGYVVFPAARASVPRVASLHIQTASKVLKDALEGK